MSAVSEKEITKPVDGKSPSNDADARVICACYGIGPKEIAAYFANPAATYESFTNDTGAGLRCTACRLDLDLAVDAYRRGEHPEEVSALRPIDIAGSSLLSIPTDQSNSGFFVNSEGLDTVIRVANRGPMFDKSADLSGYSYVFELFDPSGDLKVVKKGRFAANSDLQFRLSEIPQCPGRGVFVLTLSPETLGWVGSIRPQVGIYGTNWVATYHAQLVSAASLVRSLPLSQTDGRLNARLVTINPYPNVSRIQIELNSIADKLTAKERADIPAMGSSFVKLDDVFQKLPDERAFRIRVRSTTPVRNYIVNMMPDGAWNIDHFPNTK